MEIFCENLSKKFGSQKIFKNLNLHIPSKSAFAITGSNGSGKSTLLKVLAQLNFPDKGIVTYKKNGELYPSSEIADHIAFCAPYQELPLHLTLAELISFHNRSRPTTHLEFNLEECGLHSFLDRRIESFSSGMTQRVKLALAFSTNSELLFLDEPTSNLDKKGKDFYHILCQKSFGKKTLLISSNEEFEYEFCNQILNIESIGR